MPFAGYKNFDDCVARNQDKDDPKAYCAAIMHKVEKPNKAIVTKPPEKPKPAANVTHPTRIVVAGKPHRLFARRGG